MKTLPPIQRKDSARLSRAWKTLSTWTFVVLLSATAGVASGAETEAPDARWHNASASEVSHHRRDAWITAKVKSKVLAISVNKGAGVHVTTSHGVVTLTGKVADKAFVGQAKRAAQDVDGVQRVDVSDLATPASISNGSR